MPLALIALATGVAGCASKAAGSPSDSTVTYAGYDGPALVSVDGRTVTVGGFIGVCIGTLDIVADETSTQVALRMRYTTPKTHAVCNAAMAIVQASDVHLKAPLGTRTLVNGENGHPVPSFDENKMLHPRWLPTGYARVVVSPALSAIQSTGTPPPAACVQYLRSPTDGELTIAQVVGPLPTPQGEPIKIRGHAGQADAHSIAWSEDGETIRISIYSSDSTKPLTIADLVTLADDAT